MPKFHGILIVTTLKEDTEMSSFDKIAGYKKEKEELMALVEIFNNRKKYELKGATLPKGIIFYGPAGTGKTLFSEVLARECSLKKVNISISDSASENNICRKINKAFLQGARGRTPTMIFFDELDKVLPNQREEYYSDRSKTILAQLLTLLDGMEKVNNVIFVATCNDYYALPESITRAGRFDKKICLDIPDLSTRTAILDMYIKASPTKFEMSAESIAKLTEEFSPAALKTLVNDCIFVSDENNFVSEGKIREKILEIKEEDIPTERSDQSYNIDATRNVGSFLIARSYSCSDYVLTVEANKVSNGFLDSIIDGTDYDYDDYDDDDDDRSNNGKGSYSIASKNDYIAAITALLGGIAVEELLLGKIYDNIEHNMEAVDNLILKMASCGMLGFDLYYNKNDEYKYSEKHQEKLEEVTFKILQECYDRAKEQIKKNELLVKKLIPILIKRKSIEKSECESILEELGGII